MVLVGELALWVALLMAAWGAIVSFAGGRSRRPELVASGERAIYATFACVVLATAGLVVGLATSDFSLQYVGASTTANLPVAYKLIALWGGPAGSLLFWTLLLSMFATMTVATSRVWSLPLRPYVTATLSVVSLSFLAAACFTVNPYERVTVIPGEGHGMHPRLQHLGMAVHPLAVDLGYVATTIPFAFAIGALLARRIDSDWALAVRRWSVVSWFFITIGMIAGMWWGYVEIDWNRLWPWDPARSLSWVPWLAVTATLSASLVWERGEQRRAWIVGAAASSFPAVLFVACAARGGIISRVHAFAPSDVRYWFVSLLIVAVLAVACLAVTRLGDLQVSGLRERLASPEPRAPVNDFLLVATAFSILWGTLFPMLANAGRDRTIVPLGIVLGALTGLAPVIAWQRMPLENRRRQLPPVVAAVVAVAILLPLGVRDPYALLSLALAAFVVTAALRDIATNTFARRRRLGGYLVRAGIIALSIAFAGFAFRAESHVSLAPGAAADLVDPYGHRWAFASQGVSEFEQLNRQVLAVGLTAKREGATARLIRTERRQYIDSRGAPVFEPTTEAGIDYSLRQDVYVVMTGVAGDRAEIRIEFNPLVAWVWIGGLMVAVGGAMVMWPTQ